MEDFIDNVNQLRELEGRSERQTVPERKSEEQRKIVSKKCPETLSIAAQNVLSKKFQQDFGLSLPTELAHNRNKTTMNKVLVDASLIEEQNKIKKDLEAEQ